MKLSPPSIGLVFTLAVYSCCALFFAWGLAEPEQDRVWNMGQKIRAGNFSAADSQELEFLQREIDKDESLARWLLRSRPEGLISPNARGWSDHEKAALARIKDDSQSCFIELKIAGPKGVLPVTVQARSLHWQASRTLSSSGTTVTLDLPPVEGKAELILLYVQSKKKSALPISLYARLQCRPKASAGE